MKRFFSSFDMLKKQLGLVMKWEYMAYTLTNKKAAEELYKIALKTGQFTNQKEESRLLNEFFREHFDDVDQEAYMFYTLKTIYENHDEEIAADIIRNCKKYLRGANISHYKAEPTTFGRTAQIVRQTARDLTGEKPDQAIQDQARRWEKIKKDIPQEIMFEAKEFNWSNNLHVYCNNKMLREYLRRLIYISVLEEDGPIPTDDKVDMLNRVKQINIARVSQLDNELRQKGVDYFKYYKHIPEYIDKFPDEFNLDVLLLMVASNTIDELETKTLSAEENIQKANVLKSCMKHIVHKREGLIDSPNTPKEQKREKPFTYQSLIEACERINENGYYFSKERIATILDKIYEDPSIITSLPPGEIKVLKLSDKDVDYILDSEGTIGYLLENKLIPITAYRQRLAEGKISQTDAIDLLDKKRMSIKDLKGLLEKTKIIEDDMFEYLNKQNILLPEEKIQLFFSGKVNFEQIESLSEKEKLEIAEHLSPGQFVKFFREKEVNKEEYIRFAQVFRSLVLKDKSKEERKRIDDEIIEEFGDDVDDNILEELYKSHLISFITLRDWSGPQVISEMMEKTEIRPEDAKDMCYNGDFNALYAALENPRISRSKKMGIFRTSFANIDYELMPKEKRDMLKDARDHCLRLINLLDIKNLPTGERKENDENGEERVVDGEKRHNEYTSDPLQRWDLIDLMGNYSYEMLDQGLAIFKFPEYKGGTIVLEKMYRKDKPEYGRATKILNMTLEEFEQIKSDLIINQDIPPFMVDSYPLVQGRLTNLAHTTSWGQQFADYFGYNIEGERTPEDIARIDKKIQSILNSRELRK